MKTKIIFTHLLVFLFFGASFGQETAELSTVKNRIDVIQFHVLPGSKTVGAGIKYKSLYSLAEVFHFGWGVGIESYNSTFYRSFIPVTLELVGDLSTSGKTPFYSVSLGYGIALPEERSFAESARGGVMYNIGFGYRNKNTKSRPFASIGYRGQFATYSGVDQSGDDNKSVVYKRWNIAVGVFF